MRCATNILKNNNILKLILHSSLIEIDAVYDHFNISKSLTILMFCTVYSA